MLLLFFLMTGLLGTTQKVKNKSIEICNKGNQISNKHFYPVITSKKCTKSKW